VDAVAADGLPAAEGAALDVAAGRVQLPRLDAAVAALSQLGAHAKLASNSRSHVSLQMLRRSGGCSIDIIGP
jgi:hypothetical protein